MKITRVVTLCFLLSAGGFSASEEHPYVKRWKGATFGKRALATVVVGAGLNQLTGHPKEYGGGIAGFGKRLAGGFATHTVKTTVEHVVAAPLHEQLDYERSEKTGFGPRLGYALKSTVITRNTRTGRKTPAIGRISGHAAAGAFAQTVLPGVAGASTAGFGLAAEAGMNVAREFWPRRHKD